MKTAYQYQVVNEARQPAGHMMYQLRHKSKNGALTEFWIGANRLKRFYQQNKIVGQISSHVKYVVTNEPKKLGRPKKVKLTPRVKDEELEPSEIIKMANDINPRMYSLPDVFVVEPLVRYKAVKTAKGWDVIDSNGEIMMDDMNEEMAKDYANELNKNTQ